MSSRDTLLATLRSQSVPEVPLPSLIAEWIRYPDPSEQFRVALGQAAGSVVSVGVSGGLPQLVLELEAVRSAAKVCSLVSSVAGNCDIPAAAHAFADVDVLIVAAEFGVAENGAVWIDGAAAPVRSALFLAQHLVVLLPHGEIVDNLHQAYERIGSRLAERSYGCFMSGPSKTADIEQALVVGAHGARSLTVVLY